MRNHLNLQNLRPRIPEPETDSEIQNRPEALGYAE